MPKRGLRSLVEILIILTVGAGIAWAGSQGGSRVGEVPLFALCAAIAFGLNMLAFIPAYHYQTERYFDLMGSITYIALISAALALGGDIGARDLLLASMIAIWALRLGPFLFARVTRDGSDGRFDRIKIYPAFFAMVWTLQGLWTLLTAACALAALTSPSNPPLGGFAFAGFGLWGLGLAMEVIADKQKQAFRARPENRDRYITSGLWAWSRHPNYFGEITLWVGVALVALPALSGWQFLSLISPIFVYVLLTRISGVPLLEARAQRRWGEEEGFQQYTRQTPTLFPRPPRKAGMTAPESGA